MVRAILKSEATGSKQFGAELLTQTARVAKADA